MITLQAYLDEEGVPIKAFAARIEVTPMTVYRYLRGKSRPTWDVLDRIAKATNGRVPPEAFLRNDDPKPKSVHAA